MMIHKRCINIKALTLLSKLMIWPLETICQFSICESSLTQLPKSRKYLGTNLQNKIYLPIYKFIILCTPVRPTPNTYTLLKTMVRFKTTKSYK